MAFSLIYPRFARGRCNEGFSSKARRFLQKLLCFGRLIYPWLMVNPPGLIVFCAPLKAGSQGRGGGGAWAVAEGKKIETISLHESHQGTKRVEFR